MRAYRPAERRKIVRRLGLLGAAGCLAGALLGEAFLRLLPAPAAPRRAVCLVIDCSGSMRQDGKLAEVQAAAGEFVRRQDLRAGRVAVVQFASDASVVAPLTSDLPALERAIAGLERYSGSTATGQGLQTALDALRGAGAARSILLFTDGRPDSQEEALDAARASRGAGIPLVVVATRDADIRHLDELTGNPALVFPTTAGHFAEAFESAERALDTPQLMEFAPAGARHGLAYRLLRSAGWTALLTLGLALALVTAQNHYGGRPLLPPGHAAAIAVGSLLAGTAAGAVGEGVFAVAARVPTLLILGRVLAWVVLGALLGRGMAFFVPNLPPDRALLGGAIGGALGAVGFLGAAGAFADVAGRLLGAALLGFLIGLMIALVEYLWSRPAVGLERLAAGQSTGLRRLRVR